MSKTAQSVPKLSKPNHMPAKKKDESEVNLTKNLEKLGAIAEWFDEQEEVDIEEGLKKVREASGLIKESRGRLSEIENEFLTIRREIEEE